MSRTAVSRLQKELIDIKKNPPLNISAGPRDDNMMIWDATIIGPTGTPYEGGIFLLEILFPNNYPFRPPKVRFLTKVWHPNVNLKGGICIDILKDKWTASLMARTVLLSISSLLAMPNPDDPLVPEIAKIYKTDIETYNNIAKMWTVNHAK